jgi:hypothetical protein
MPLTPSHAAAAPLLQRLIRPLGIVLPLSALVVGTMTPDFEYLIRLAPGGGVWHTRVGLLEFCLPAGLATWLIFRKLIAPALLRLLPPALGEAAGTRVTPGPTLRLIPGAIVAIVIGVISHDFWDSFTHQFGWGVRQLPWLNRLLRTGPHNWLRYYAILQYASSVIGLLAVMAILWHWVAKQPSGALDVPAGERAWRIREGGFLFVSAILGGALNASRPHDVGPTWAIGAAAVGGMSALAVALLAYGIADSVRQRAQAGMLTPPSARHEASSR